MPEPIQQVAALHHLDAQISGQCQPPTQTDCARQGNTESRVLHTGQQTGQQPQCSRQHYMQTAQPMAPEIPCHGITEQCPNGESTALAGNFGCGGRRGNQQHCDGHNASHCNQQIAAIGKQGQKGLIDGFALYQAAGGKPAPVLFGGKETDKQHSGQHAGH